MILSNAFDHVMLLDKAADASFKRETLIANNIANATTPTYKRKDLDFKSILEDELTQPRYAGKIGSAIHGTADKIKEGSDSYFLVPGVYKDYENYSYRLDDNNVDIDTENVELASEQIRYQALTGLISQQFSHLRTVIGS